MNETEEQLARMNEEYENAETPEQGQFDPLPNGKYQVNVEEIFFEDSKAGNLMLKWNLRVISGKFANRMVFKHHMLQSANNMIYLKGDLETCGMILTKLSDLQARLEELLDIKLEVTVKNKEADGETRTNVYFNTKLIMASDIPNDKTSNGDIPF